MLPWCSFGPVPLPSRTSSEPSSATMMASLFELLVNDMINDSFRPECWSIVCELVAAGSFEEVIGAVERRT